MQEVTKPVHNPPDAQQMIDSATAQVSDTGQ
jgi:hypothetical protein